MPVRWRVAVLAVSLAIPAIRFGKPQARLAFETLRGEVPTWSDLALYRDAQDAAARLRAEAKPGDTLLVWGYRPEINVLAALPPATRFLDSQPLTGVIADRHLASTHVTFPELAAANRAALTWTQPTWILDGLGPLNPHLAITACPDLGPWLSGYERVAETKATVLYRRRR